MFSLVLHLSLLLVLAWCVLGAEPQPDADALHVIRVVPAMTTPELPLQTVQIAIPNLVGVQAVEPRAQPISAPPIEIDPGAQPPAIALASFSGGRAGPVEDVAALFGKAGRATATVGSAQQGAEFFGVRCGGDRFVFVVDCSRSMGEGDRWYDATRELLAAVERLGPSQAFYVIFFDGESHPMFSADLPEPDLLPATAENIARFREWMQSVRLGPYTRPAKSMQVGLKLQPDAIYLLSDGVFEDQTAALLRRTNLVRVEGRKEPQVVINTIGFHTRDGQRVLQRIANENGGQYHFVPDPRLARMAKQGQ